MECSMCGDAGFQIYVFQCSKCLLRFQHQYCSRTYFDNISAESIYEICDWCYDTPQKAAGSDIRDSVKIARRMKNCVEFEECTRVTHNGKLKRNLRKCCDDNNGEIPKEPKNQTSPEVNCNTERRVGTKYKFLDEIVF